MAAGVATLLELREHPPYDKLEPLSAKLATGLDRAAQKMNDIMATG